MICLKGTVWCWEGGGFCKGVELANWLGDVGGGLSATVEIPLICNMFSLSLLRSVLMVPWAVHVSARKVATSTMTALLSR